MKNLFILLLAGLALTGCKKEITELEPASETGANIFGAKVDGKLWGPQGFGVLPGSPLVEGRVAGDNSFLVEARNSASLPNESAFQIYLKGVTGPELTY